MPNLWHKKILLLIAGVLARNEKSILAKTKTAPAGAVLHEAFDRINGCKRTW
jgi:hypothetical protein